MITELIRITEQRKAMPLNNLSDYLKKVLSKSPYEKRFYYKNDLFCYQIFKEADNYSAASNYFVGVDWLVREKAAIYVEPKMNTEDNQIDFWGMLLESLDAQENLDHLEGLYHAEYDEAWIGVPTKDDILSPVLIIQFLKLLHRIVQKGLKKNYYKVTENLNSKVKGKILVGQQIKENVVKHRIMRTVCTYERYGINHLENQFLKLVLKFVSSWLHLKKHIFNKSQQSQLINLLHYCEPAFETVDELKNKHQVINANKNVFYNEYSEAIKIGGYILRKFSFNIHRISKSTTITPPFWIDMSKLFELYVFQKLKKLFPGKDIVSYHDSFAGGKETDILIKADNYKCVVDCKYKPQYNGCSPSLEDKRQLAGYVRLRSVYTKLEMIGTETVKGLIIYPHQSAPTTIGKEDLFETPIEEYIEFYKLGVALPQIDSGLPN